MDDGGCSHRHSLSHATFIPSLAHTSLSHTCSWQLDDAHIDAEFAEAAKGAKACRLETFERWFYKFDQYLLNFYPEPIPEAPPAKALTRWRSIGSRRKSSLIGSKEQQQLVDSAGRGSLADQSSSGSGGGTSSSSSASGGGKSSGPLSFQARLLAAAKSMKAEQEKQQQEQSKAPTELFAKSSGGGGATSSKQQPANEDQLSPQIQGGSANPAGSTPTLRAFEA